MDYINIENLGIPMVGLGTFSMHGEELKAVITSAMGMGYRFFDTAYRYGNESEIGDIVKAQQDEIGNAAPVVLSTKYSGLQYPGRKNRLFLDKKSPKRALSTSLHCLCRDHIDLYLLHSPFRGFQKAYEKMLKEKEKGRITVTGVSGYSVDQLKMIKDYCGVYPMIDMIELHPYHSSRALVDFCKENGIKLIARSPFAHGEILPLLSTDKDITSIANEHNKSVPQVVLRWIIQQGVVALPRTKNPSRLQETINVFDVELTSSEMHVIDMKNKDLSFGAVKR